jgi:hypothetical protein
LNLPHSVWEIRSPRTLQGPAQRKPGALTPGFWVHQIKRQEERLRWTARLFVFDSGRFRWATSKEWFGFDCP